MAFGETFHDLRTRRRIPMRMFEQVGVSPSYIHDIERKGVLPTKERLHAIGEVFKQVAKEQMARDPDDDVRLLLREHDRTLFVERLGEDPGWAELLVDLRELDDAQRDDLLQAMRQS